MPAKPLSDEALGLIDAVREALAEHGGEVEEKRMFGCHVFMVNGKLCLGVEDDELLVRLPPGTHAAVAETPGVRTLSSKGLMDGYFYIGPSAYATQAQWQHWVDSALAFNPLAKATPKKAHKPAAQGKDAARSVKKSNPSAPSLRKSTKTAAKTENTARKHSVFDDDDL
jgi:TfoX/Sxy family transcriptional regulator of competence genes